MIRLFYRIVGCLVRKGLTSLSHIRVAYLFFTITWHVFRKILCVFYRASAVWKATIPKVRLRYFTLRHPHSPMVRFNDSWSGQSVIDSVR